MATRGADVSDLHPYPTRLYWDGRAGFIRRDGIEVRLWDAPSLGGEPLHCCDFIPVVGIAELMPRPCDPRRAMNAAEVAAAMALLADVKA